MLSWAMPSWLAGGTGCSDCAVNEVDLSKLLSGTEECRRPEGFGSMRARSEAAAQERPVDEDRRLIDMEVTRIERELEDQKAKEQRRRVESEAAEEAEHQERAKRQEVEQRRVAFNRRFRERREALEREAALREAEVEAARDWTEDRGKLDAWLDRSGFSGVSVKKVTVTKTTYPLHAAVEQNDAEVVRWLLHFGASVEQRDSAGETAQEVAAKSNKDVCNDEILRVLEASRSNT